MLFDLLPKDILHEIIKRLNMTELICAFRRVCRQSRVLVDQRVWYMCRYWLPELIYKDQAYHEGTSAERIYAYLRRYTELVPMANCRNFKSMGDILFDTSSSAYTRIEVAYPLKPIPARWVIQQRDFRPGDMFSFDVGVIGERPYSYNIIKQVGVGVHCNCKGDDLSRDRAINCGIKFELGGVYEFFVIAKKMVRLMRL